MKIQSLSITVPTNGCINNCKFCVSKMHKNPYHGHTSMWDVADMMQYARDNGVDTLIITSANGEALQNYQFVKDVFTRNNKLRSPFIKIELQTTGVLLDDEKISDLRRNGLKTISLSVTDIFDDDHNHEIIQTKEENKFVLTELTKKIKKYGLTLRISINLLEKPYKDKTPLEIFNRLKVLGADQVTLRYLYSDGHSKIGKWTEENRLPMYSNGESNIKKLNDFIKQHGNPLEVLPFGARRYSYNGMSTVLDDDCMNKNPKEDDGIKYFIIRENGKLYTRWDDAGSLLF